MAPMDMTYKKITCQTGFLFLFYSVLWLSLCTYTHSFCHSTHSAVCLLFSRAHGNMIISISPQTKHPDLCDLWSAFQFSNSHTLNVRSWRALLCTRNCKVCYYIAMQFNNLLIYCIDIRQMIRVPKLLLDPC